jgi:hypothetical protein
MAMAKVIPVEQTALEALARLLGDPSSKLLHGSKGAPGVFVGGSAAEKAAARLCLENRWLESTGEFAGKGKTRKELYRITALGLQAVLERSDASKLLRSLTDSLKLLAEGTSRIPQALQDNLSAFVRGLDALKADIQKSVGEALRPVEAAQATLRLLQANITNVLEKTKPIDAEELTRKLAAGKQVSETASARSENWAGEVVRLVTEQKQRNALQRLTLPQLFERIRARKPDLTLGQFHDGLRRLQDERRIRLSPYTQALATLDDPRNALFLDREVKFYVELP